MTEHAVLQCDGNALLSLVRMEKKKGPFGPFVDEGGVNRTAFIEASCEGTISVVTDTITLTSPLLHSAPCLPLAIMCPLLSFKKPKIFATLNIRTDSM